MLRLAGKLDPDEFVRKHGLDRYLSLATAAPRHFEYLLDEAVKGRDLSSYEQKSAALRDVIPALSQVPDRIERAGYVNALAERLGIEDEVMLAEIKDGILKTPKLRPAEQRRSGAPAALADSSESEARLMRGLLESAEIRNEVLARLGSEDLAGSAIEEIFRAVEGLCGAGEQVSYARLSELLREPARSQVARLAVRNDPHPSREEALRCVESLQRDRLLAELQRLQREMKGKVDDARLDAVMRRINEVSILINSLLEPAVPGGAAGRTVPRTGGERGDARP